MNRRGRYILLILGMALALHYIFTLKFHEYRRLTSISSITSYATNGPADRHAKGPTISQSSTQSHKVVSRRANASFVMLARNSDVDGAVRSIRALEDRFNKRHGYPYVFLNDIPFTQDFIERVSVLTQSTVEFGVIPKDYWHQPDWIDEERASTARYRMTVAGVKYADSISYRNMCRFNSGFFFRHELLQKYRWYWRVEPSVRFHCDISEDPFLFMENHDKIYSFTITVYEIMATIPTLWGHVKDFVKNHPEFVAPDNAMGFLSYDGGETYNRCHFWSNFEIADMDFWRGPAYTAFFEYLDSTGGFYYERWGDAPVHSIAAGIFARKDQIHFFEEIGYQHDDWSHCPLNKDVWEKKRCSCDREQSFDYDGNSCKGQWDRLMQS